MLQPKIQPNGYIYSTTKKKCSIKNYSIKCSIFIPLRQMSLHFLDMVWESPPSPDAADNRVGL